MRPTQKKGHGRFDQVYAILVENTFDEEFHAELQKLWYQAHYTEFEVVRGRKLGAVDKYRIRRKYPLPKTIWDGEKTVYCFKERARRTLYASFSRNRYPNPEEKQALATETDLTMTQVRHQPRGRESNRATGGPLCSNLLLSICPVRLSELTA
ncbi:unnamed protein product [Dibothriocephalus latus]|uniref:Homeobox domain-containing protein n=1 Tax=Dibothriocephalus latus TaxID=60516 RepID=A0A3P7L1U7_DIBLA|nr:unnamed protein product [Dibothriocephalus latus]